MTARRALFVCCTAAVCVILLAGLSMAQLIVPVDKRMPAPQGLDFRGTWQCGSVSDSAMLQVGGEQRYGRHRGWRNAHVAALPWTYITEKDSGFAGHYLVLYDRDKKQFVMIDADDPAYAAYATEGWADGSLTLTSLESPNQPSAKHRWVYAVSDDKQFTVTLETQENDNWIAQRSSTCRKMKGKRKR